MRNDDSLSGAPAFRLGEIWRMTAVLSGFEVVYHLLSIGHNLAATLKVRTHDRENPEVPSVTLVWRGAHFQERETYDLMGIRFQGHPDLRRIFLWDGFPGHPLRKDWLNFPGGQMAGLERFPGEPRGPLEGRGERWGRRRSASAGTPA